MSFLATGVDEEGRTDRELDALVRSVEGALRGLPGGSRLAYTNTRACSPALCYQGRHLEANARFCHIDLHWCLTFEPPKVKAFTRKPEEQSSDNGRMLADLQKTANLLERHLGTMLGLRLLSKQQAFQFFSYLFNLQDWSEQDILRSDEGVDRQVVKSPVAWQSDHFLIGRRAVQMFSLQATPEASRSGLFSDLLTLDCDSILCSAWRVKSTASARKRIDQ